ncbi:MAG: hypothetical protein OWS74_05965 [Firmicutes bacterium]|nr:hypothetical protein [Bacillota bacterium]
MPLTAEELVRATGFASCAHLSALHISCPPKELPPNTLWYHHALWDKAHFGQGAHIAHRHLVTDIYLAAYHAVDGWQLEPPLNGLHPDALWIQKSDSATWLIEADTGKESHRQWQRKWLHYRAHPVLPGSLAIITTTLSRADRLKQWISEWPPLSTPWHVATLSELSFPLIPPRSQSAAGPDAGSFPEEPPPALPAVFYQLPDGTRLSESQGRLLLASLSYRLDGCEIKHQTRLIYLHHL